MNRGKTFETCFFYKLLADRKGISFFLHASKVLAIPYLIIAVSYIFLRSDTLINVPIEFWFEMTIGSIWFVVGPILVYRIMKQFVGLRHKKDFTPELRIWFSDNEQKHYRIYKRCMKILAPIFIAIAVPMLIYRPEVLTKIAGVTYGYSDPYFWAVIIFLIWFLIYCTNAISVISLIVIIANSIRKQDVLSYNPLAVSHYKCIQGFIGFCNMVVSYTCSGLLFIPFAILFIRQQGYIEWVAGILFFYSAFLFAAITYPKMTIRAYVKERATDFLLKEKIQYLNDIKTDRYLSRKNFATLTSQIQQYNSYLYIQELKTVCFLKIEIDTNTVATYISAIISAIPGVIALWVQIP